MYKLNFNKPIHVHFIGIGGISMSGLAEILLEEGFTISGSDSKESDLTRALASKGATIFYGQKASNIIPGINVIVYTAAMQKLSHRICRCSPVPNCLDRLWTITMIPLQWQEHMVRPQPLP